VKGDKFTKNQIVAFLDEKGIGTRPIMAGNIMRQPAYKNHPEVRKFGELVNADIITERGFWVGCWHGLDDAQIDYTIGAFDEFIARY
jgi:CDP-6-deoxy-D-xylo-4-hexulose-3-dehydrase